jgi:hypothetical protein
MANPELPSRLSEIESRGLSQQSVTIDHQSRIAELDRRRGRIIAAIKSAGLAAELREVLKSLTAQLEQLKAMSTATPAAARRGSADTVERRVIRMLDRMAEKRRGGAGSHARAVPGWDLAVRRPEWRSIFMGGRSDGLATARDDHRRRRKNAHPRVFVSADL